MKFLFKKTKIVSTFGPAVSAKFDSKGNLNDPEIVEKINRSTEIIGDLFFHGVNCVRFNFSHGFSEENNARIFLINRVQKKILDDQANSKYKFLRAVAFMADTKGPEIRVYNMTPEGISYKIGQIITVYCKEKVIGSPEGFSVFDSTETYNMANDCIVGNSILVEDGKLTLEILEVDKEAGKVKAKVKNNSHLKTNKRINLPGADYSMKFLSQKDIEDIKYAIDQGFEYVALSFVNSRKDVDSVRDLRDAYCREKGIENNMKIYSKIETTKSCENIDEIIEASDGIMVARGDLGLEIPYYTVPYWTGKMIEKCRLSRKPVIVATQMLDSLERNVVATRAEVSDVYRAAEMCSDCTMLSGETAQGLFPVVAVRTMSEIVFESEKHIDRAHFDSFFDENIYPSLSPKTKERCKSLLKAVEASDSSAILMSNEMDEEFLIAASSMCLPIPLFNFVKVSNLSALCSDSFRGSKDYQMVKKLTALALHRGIYFVFTEGNFDSSNLKDVLREFVSSYAKSQNFKADLNKVITFHENNWKV